MTYGVDDGPRATVPPARPAWEREADRAAAAARVTGCPRCDGIPAELVAALTKALTDARGVRAR